MTNLLIATLIIALLASISLNIYLLRRRPKKGSQSIELREFLVDLMAGPAMLAIARIDPNDILMRSPKHK